MGLVKARLTVAVSLIQSLPLDPGRSGIAPIHHTHLGQRPVYAAYLITAKSALVVILVGPALPNPDIFAAGGHRSATGMT